MAGLGASGGLRRSAGWGDRVTGLPLIQAAAHGDDHAFQQIAHQRRRQLRAIARSRYAPGHSPDDLDQEALIGLHAAVKAYDPARGVPFGAWVNLVVTRRLDAHVRSALRSRHLILSDAARLQDEPLEPPTGRDVSGDVHDRELVRRIFHAVVTALSPLERVAAEGALSGAGYMETAARAGLHEKQVDNAMARARAKIAAAVEAAA